MGRVNTKRVKSLQDIKLDSESHKNFMAGNSFDVTPLVRLRMVGASCFFGEPSYYKGSGSSHKKLKRSYGRYNLQDSEREYLREELNAIDDYDWRNLSSSETIEKCIDEAIFFHGVEEVLKVASEMRNKDLIRVTPQIIMVRCANWEAQRRFAVDNKQGSGLIRRYAKEILKRADEPATQLAYQLEKYGRPIPMSLRRAWSDRLEKSSDYELAKYRLENLKVKTVDVVRLAHPKVTPSIKKLLEGELKLEGRTWESVRSSGGSWKEALEVMPYMALLRNIRNLIENKVPENEWVHKIVEGAETGKQVPFRYLSAYKVVEKIASGKVLDALEEAMEISVGNISSIGGHNLILSDNSGSTRGTPISELSTMTVAEIGNLMGVITGKLSDSAHLGIFGDKLKAFEIRKKSSIFDQCKKANDTGHKIGQSTENGIWIALNDAIKEKVKYDNIFIYSDMQAGHGGLYGIDPDKYREYIWPRGGNHIDVPKMIRIYREQVNSKVNVFLVQIAGYEDTILPEYYDRTYILGGWSGQILNFAKKVNDLRDQN